MSLILGIDTGGTFTDSVLLDSITRNVYSKSKVLTTKEDLTLCIDRCLALLPQDALPGIHMICLSTTLATNAVLEGYNGRVGLLIMGRMPDKKLPASLCRHIDGLLDIKGRVIKDINEAQVRQAALDFSGQVDAVAVSGFAGVRNPNHELRVKNIVHDTLGMSVVCAHELSTSLGFYDRTVTAIINAGLIYKIEGLILAVRQILFSRGITAPVMVVKGDGSLIRDEIAMSRPIETILSGPAASIVGGLYLSGANDALLLDMGGTTTDIAFASNGKVKLDLKGATLGGWRTMVHAAEIATFGIGGDSYITPKENNRLSVGPRRVRPLCTAGSLSADLSREIQNYSTFEESDLSIEAHTVFYELLRKPSQNSINAIQKKLIRLLEQGPKSVASLSAALDTETLRINLEEMVKREIVLPISLTPTDILHAQGKLILWDVDAARAGALIYAKKFGIGMEILLEYACEAVVEKICLSCIESALQFTDVPLHVRSDALDFLAHKELFSDMNDLLQTGFSLNKPVIAIGAPVASWLPDVCKKLGTKLQIPEHAEVANAIGAAVGEVRVLFQALIRPDKKMRRFTVYFSQGAHVFEDLETAQEWALTSLHEDVTKRVREWGGARPKFTKSVEPKFINGWDGNPLYVETMITVEAIANPSSAI